MQRRGLRTELAGDGGGFQRVERSRVYFQILFEVLPLHVLHGDEEIFVQLSASVDLNDVRIPAVRLRLEFGALLFGVNQFAIIFLAGDDDDALQDFTTGGTIAVQDKRVLDKIDPRLIAGSQSQYYAIRAERFTHAAVLSGRRIRLTGAPFRRNEIWRACEFPSRPFYRSMA